VSAAALLLGWALAVSALAALALARRGLAAERRRVAEAAHELRGPLATARLALEGLADRRVAAAELELRRAGLALDELTGGDARERVELVDLAMLLECAADAWRALAGAHGARLVVEHGDEDELLVRADTARLVQAASNLVANAAEHGGGEVRVRARRAASRVRLEVSDDGPGLIAPLADLLARPARPGPRGHGLAIAARAAARSGGRLTTAPSAQGACLVLELPAPGEARTEARRWAR